MDPDNNSPELDHKARLKRAEMTYERLIKELQSKLDELPEGQKIPTIPVDAEIVDTVTEHVISHGLKVTTSAPTKIFIGGELLDHSGLKEGRVGIYKNLRTLSFLYLCSDKTLRTIIITPRDGIDARILGMAIAWGLLANIPDTIVATKPGTVADFFSINAYDLSKFIDIPALELFKKEYRKSCDEELKQKDLYLTRCGKEKESIQKKIDELSIQIERHLLVLEEESDRACRWQLTAMIAIVLIPIVVGICHFFRL